jgi:hypothetical protein
MNPLLLWYDLPEQSVLHPGEERILASPPPGKSRPGSARSLAGVGQPDLSLAGTLTGASLPVSSSVWPTASTPPARRDQT